MRVRSEEERMSRLMVEEMWSGRVASASAGCVNGSWMTWLVVVVVTWSE